MTTTEGPYAKLWRSLTYIPNGGDLDYVRDVGAGFGLSLPAYPTEEAVRAHMMVIRYLCHHPDVRARYGSDQSGEVKYFDVLTMAEEEGIAVCS